MKKQRLWTAILFAVYLLLLVWVVLFKLNFSIASIHRVRALNLIPFYYEDVYAGDIPLFEALLNVLIFLPLGIYLKMLGISGRAAVLTGFLMSCAFEILQYCFRLGASDITDVITNTLGAFCGVLLYRLVCRMTKERFRADRLFRILAAICSAGMLGFFLLSLVSFLR